MNEKYNMKEFSSIKAEIITVIDENEKPFKYPNNSFQKLHIYIDDNLIVDIKVKASSFLTKERNNVSYSDIFDVLNNFRNIPCVNELTLPKSVIEEITKG